ncbi:unnamed protein product [Rotaria socialis]|uniref:ADP ribosyltransferase domain-containing protein n=2 Tax=Rotaria socialis TaxID=392032 RepID=A0A820KE94_9BILA|nr:unnamed protein product [Rotaria socialis]
MTSFGGVSCRFSREESTTGILAHLIYININSNWIHDLFVDRSKLVARIEQDQKARTKTEAGSSISVITSGSQSLETRNAIFMWFQLFIEVLLRMNHKSDDREEILNMCKNSYKGNKKEMKIIDDFEKNYKAENAIWWYTLESCFHKILNKALRVQDFDTLFALRFFIADIAKQIKDEHKKFIRTSANRHKIRVYRGQTISNDELELMKKSTGEFLSINSFLSTSHKRSVAVNFARTSHKTHENQRIIFEIEIDLHLQTKAFANIAPMSAIKTEDEVFIDHDAGLWIAHVSLASEEDFKWKETFSSMKATIGETTDLNSLEKILVEMGENEQAQKCYKRMLNEAQLASGNAELGLGRVNILCRQADEGLQHLKDALIIKERILGQNHADVGEIHTWLGTLNWYVRHDLDQALENLKKAIKIQEATLSPDSLPLALTYSNIADTYESMGNYDLGLEYHMKVLKIRKTTLPESHPHIAETFNNVGTLYEHKGNNTEALEYFEKSMEIKQKFSPPTHEEYAVTATNIERLKKKMQNQH